MWGDILQNLFGLLPEIFGEAAVRISQIDAVYFAVLFAIGFLQNYFGYRLLQLWLWIGAAVVGAALFGMAGGALWGMETVVLTGLAGAVVFGWIALKLQRLAVFVLGSLIGALVMIVVVPDPAAIVIGAIVTGAIFVGLYKMAIVCGTVVTGAFTLTYTTLSFAHWWSRGGYDYLWESPYRGIHVYGRMLIRTLSEAGPGELGRRFGMDLAVFGILAMTGFWYQMRQAEKERPRARGGETTRARGEEEKPEEREGASTGTIERLPAPTRDEKSGWEVSVGRFEKEGSESRQEKAREGIQHTEREREPAAAQGLCWCGCGVAVSGALFAPGHAEKARIAFGRILRQTDEARFVALLAENGFGPERSVVKTAENRQRENPPESEAG